MTRPYATVERAGSAGLFRRWVLAFTLGELVGFGCIPVLGAALASVLTTGLALEARSLLLYGVAVAGGLGEGAVLALFQLRVLRPLLPQLHPGRWVAATALAAALAWACGMLAPTLDDLFGLAASVQVAIWVPASVLILLSIGAAQAWVLRGIVRAPVRWLAANALGWLAGLPWTFVLPALLPESAPVAAWVLVFVMAGVLMGVTAGAVTGAFLIRLEPAAAAGSERLGDV